MGAIMESDASTTNGDLDDLWRQEVDRLAFILVKDTQEYTDCWYRACSIVAELKKRPLADLTDNK